jgi:hypothetical protein
MHLSEILQWQYTVKFMMKIVMLLEHQVCCTEFYLATLILLSVCRINIHLTLNLERRCQEVQDARISTLYNVIIHFTLTCWIKKKQFGVTAANRIAGKAFGTHIHFAALVL